MKKICTAFILLLALAVGNAQSGIGLRLGISAAGFKEGTKDPVTALTVGIPIEIGFGQRLALRADLGLYRYGSVYKKSSVLPTSEGKSSYATLRLPISLQFKPLSPDKKLYLSLNAGLGYGFYIYEYRDITFFGTDPITGEPATVFSEGRFSIEDEDNFNQHEIFSIFGLDIGTHLNEKYRLTLNLSYLMGLHDLNTDLLAQDEPTYIGRTPFGLSASIVMLRYF